MQVTQPDYYESFHCIAGACPDTCCVGWQVVLDQKHLEFYQSLDGDLGEQIRSGIVYIDKEPSFSLCNGRCCMLRDDGLCKIQYELGEEALSSVCGFYPRFVTELGLIREQGLSISCPEVARLVLNREEPLRCECFTVDEPLRFFHDVEPEVLLAVRQGRDRAIAVMQERTQPLAERLEKILTIAQQIQGEEIGSSYDAANQEEFCEFRTALYELFLSLEILRPDWKDLLQKGRQGKSVTSMNEETGWEQFMCYHLFKYALRSAMDDDFLEKICFGILGILLLQDLYSQGGQELVFLVQLYAKETEHNEDNLDVIETAIRENPHFSPYKLHRILRKFV